MKLYLSASSNTRTVLSCAKKAVFVAGVLVLIVSLVLVGDLYCVEAQAVTQFSSVDRFVIPTQNSTIAFALNGSYASAALEGGVWVFRDISFDDPRIPYFELSSLQGSNELRISVWDCNMTVWVYVNANIVLPLSILGYYVDGPGVQSVNLGLNTTRLTDGSEWSVIVGEAFAYQEQTFLSQGQGWTLQSDNSLMVYPLLSGNVTVMYYDYGDVYLDASLPFWLRHSVLILTTGAVAAIIAVTVIIRIKTTKPTQTSP